MSTYYLIVQCSSLTVLTKHIFSGLVSFEHMDYIIEQGAESTIVCNVVDAYNWNIIALNKYINETAINILTLDNSTGNVEMSQNPSFYVEAVSYQEYNVTIELRFANTDCSESGTFTCAIIAGNIEDPVAYSVANTTLAVYGKS